MKENQWPGDAVFNRKQQLLKTFRNTPPKQGANREEIACSLFLPDCRLFLVPPLAKPTQKTEAVGPSRCLPQWPGPQGTDKRKERVRISSTATGSSQGGWFPLGSKLVSLQLAVTICHRVPHW
jgi:hypothetical protein